MTRAGGFVLMMIVLFLSGYTLYQKHFQLHRARGARVRLRAGRGGGGLGDLAQLHLGHTEVAQTLEAAEPRQLLDPPDRVIGTERGTELAERFRGHRLVETERGREADRV